MAVAETWKNTPTFLDLVQGISEYLQASYHEAFVESRRTAKLDSWNITTYDITCVAVLTAVLSTMRYILDKYVSMPLTKYYNIPEKSRKKVPEHLWRFMFFLCIWCYEWYVVMLSGKNKFFQKPETMWHGWSLQTSPSRDVYSIIVIQFAFYLHWAYATIFLDIWRKDSVVLVLHHIAVLFMMLLVKAIHWHNIGVLAFFLHNLCDIFLHFTRLCSLFKTQGSKGQKRMKIMRYAAFACAIATWCVFRLYWYPLKMVHSAAVHPLRFNLPLNIPYGFLMNLLLWMQLILNYCWLAWIARTLYHIARFKTKDPRGYNNPEQYSEQSSTDKKGSSDILKKK